ncbi:MAG: hypothetical protein ABI378_09340 [Chitinophagaceae bacterium]
MLLSQVGTGAGLHIMLAGAMKFLSIINEAAAAGDYYAPAETGETAAG